MTQISENTAAATYEVRVLLKQLEGEVQFLQRAPEIAKIANAASNGFAYVSREFSATTVAQNPLVSGITSAASAAIGAVGSYIRPRFDDMARHSAMQIYGEIFEYNEHGIQRRDCSEAPQFNEHRCVGRTEKDKEQFLKWITENQHLYTAETYRASSHNCHHFVQAACAFLDVPIPSSVQIILNWLHNGGNSMLDYAEKIVGKCVYSSAAVGNTVPNVISSTRNTYDRAFSATRNTYDRAYTRIST